MLCHQNISNGKVLFEWEGCMVDIPDPFSFVFRYEILFHSIVGIMSIPQLDGKGRGKYFSI
jgi:hypothetical protein